MKDDSPTKKLKASPRSFQLSSDALRALKILEGIYTNKRRKDIVSDALVRTANAAAALPPIQSRRLEPSDVLALQVEVRELEKFAKEVQRGLMRVRPAEKPVAEKIITAVEKAEHELTELRTLRQKIAKMNDPDGPR